LTSPSPVDVPRVCETDYADDGFASRPLARCSSARATLAALKRSDLLLTQGRPQDALAAVLRPLGRPPRDPDLLARLRVARGLALWQSGPPAPARLQIVKAWKRAAFDLTRARALEALAIVAAGDQDWDEAHAAIEEAIALFRRSGHGALARALQCQAQVCREAGDLERALAIQDAAVETARRLAPERGLVEALTFRATLLTIAGRLADARADLVGAWSEDAPPPVRARYHVARAMLDLTQGELAAARAALADAEGAVAHGADPRTRGEVLLLLSDVLLAEGDAEPAESQAAEALAQFRAVSDLSGECRSRVRRAHALLAAQLPDEAVREARRALKAAGERRADLRGLALITLGRACLRTSARDATSAFTEALRLTLPCSFTEAARIGRAVASGAAADDPAIVRALDALEARGDRRILSYCLQDLRERFPLRGQTEEPLGAGRVATDPGLSCLVAAAEALQGPEPLTTRLAAALRALREEVPWWRAAVVGPSGILLRADREAAVGVRPSDLASVLVARGRGPVVVELAASEAWRRHPDCALHGLAWALLAPAGLQQTLYVDVREGGRRPGERELGLLAQLARLLAPHLEEPAEHSAEEEPCMLPGLIGRSAAMAALLRELERAAAGEGCVHVFGETGTGKERIAQAIHARSSRASGPWVPVNASSMSDDLFESELFGHVRGAFSGAVADRRGYVAEAEGGTLFLDEVTDLSPKAQSKLLRFVQDREYRRVGDPRLHRANVRLVTAANLRLEDCVQQGTFRQDLMYRLCQETLTLPPLRQRGDDVVRLARHFLREGRSRKQPLQVAPAVWSLIARHPWPGNVRELQSEMARARARAGEGTVRPEHLSIALTRPALGPLQPLRQALSLFERDHIARALEANGWNRARTAVQLGLSRQALLGKISRLGIAPPGLPSPAHRAAHAPRDPRAIRAAGS
jgi:DNA-binding NtrC family response regulator/tetratricopeptide (TPR) repeat protein